MIAYGTLSDQELTTLLKVGDMAASTEIFDRYNAPLYMHAFKRLQDREECRDLVQELLTTLWLKRDEISFRSSANAKIHLIVKKRFSCTYMSN